MNDENREGVRMSDFARACCDYCETLACLLEHGGTIRRRRSLREAAQNLDEEIRKPGDGGTVDPLTFSAANLTIFVAGLRKNDSESWHRLLRMAHEHAPREVYDRLVSISPFRGKVLLFVNHWPNGNMDLGGDFLRALSSGLNGLREHHEMCCERFMVALDPPKVDSKNVSRLECYLGYLKNDL